MTLKEFKVWGRKREEKDSLYIWAKDADDAIGIARLTDQSICISQWTGNEKSYAEGGIQIGARGSGGLEWRLKNEKLKKECHAQIICNSCPNCSNGSCIK